MNIISAIFLLVSFLAHKSLEPALIIQAKNITINGNTSIGGFSCEYEIAEKNDTLFIDNLSKSPYSFSIPVETFRCGNFLLNKDFQATLKAKEYPRVSVQVISLEDSGDGTLTGSIKINLVGKSKILKDVCFKLEGDPEKQVLSTDFIFKASEFQLSPPQKLGGMIKADDEMRVTVSLVLQTGHY